jgi:DNA processing protein
MTRLEALIGLNLACDMGSIRLNRLLELFGTPENILNAPTEKLMRVSRVGEETAAKISAFNKKDIDNELALAKRYGLKIITYNDPDYPENLKNIPDYPIVLYVQGELKAQDKFSLAIVGSRRASFYGLSCAGKFAADLSQYGFTIVSGMARGIDTSAHRGALKQGGRTLAVMGSGFRHLYPEENAELATEISQNGAVISEFPIDTRPLRQNFPRRNRVISGLSLGVLVVEAARNSGALITADFALEQGREVFALPGKIDTGNSFGTNGLIKQGAKLVASVEDILEEFNLDFILNTLKIPVELAPVNNSDTNQVNELSGEESTLYNLISQQPILLDEIAEKSDISIPRISEILLRLQMKKLVRELPGKQFVKN